MLRNISFNGFSEFSLVASGIFSSLVLTRVLGADLWGQYSQVQWFVNFLAALLSLGLPYAIMRFGAFYTGSKNWPQLVNTLVWLYFTQSILAAAGALLVVTKAGEISAVLGGALEPPLLRIAGVGLFAFTLLQMGGFALRGLQLFKHLAILSVALSLNLVLATLLTLRSLSVEVLTSSLFIGQLLIVPMQGYFLFSYSFSKAKSFGIHAPIRISFPFEIGGICSYAALVFLATIIEQIVWQRSEIFFLAKFCEPKFAGFYSLAYTVAGLAIGTIPVSITGILTPLFSELSGTNQPDKLRCNYQNLFNYLYFILIPLAVGLLVVGRLLISLLYGETYLEVVPVLNILCISAMLGILIRPMNSIFHARNLPWIMLACNILALFIDLVLAIKLIPQLNALGAAIANLSAQATATLLAYGFGILQLGLQYDWRSLFKMTLSALLCGGCSLLSLHILGNSFISLLVVVLVGAIIYLLLLWLLKEETYCSMSRKANTALLNYANSARAKIHSTWSKV